MAEQQTIEDLEYRQVDILKDVIKILRPRPGSHLYGEKLSMKRLGRALGLLVAITELQALTEVRERGMEEREAILKELDHPPFKWFPVPEGWESPCVNYIRKRLYSSDMLPDTAWPLWGGRWKPGEPPELRKQAEQSI